MELDLLEKKIRRLVAKLNKVNHNKTTKRLFVNIARKKKKPFANLVSLCHAAEHCLESGEYTPDL